MIVPRFVHDKGTPHGDIPLVLNGWAADDRKKRRDELLELSHLSDKRRRYVEELSAGQQRLAGRRAVARRAANVMALKDGRAAEG
jgi:ABC-type methionine transport system ATPase subunit